jgi:sugar phosphate isomerase/epimerase
MKNERRNFIRKISGLGLGMLTLPDFYPSGHIPGTRRLRKIEEICVFSKHLQFLNYDEMAETAAEIGFDGVDLTVRRGGHVLPENVKRDLPLAVKAIEKAGLTTPMMATDVNDPSDPLSETVLKTGGDLGIRHYRMAYYRYNFTKGIQQSLDEYKYWVKGLIGLNEKCSIIGNYQNHDGINVGAPIWDIWELLCDFDPLWIGCQFDIRHATVEGGHSWPIDLQLMEPYIHTLVIKDFKWEQVKGTWRISNTPIGEGMVKFDQFFEKVKELKIGGPITIHFEYPMTKKPESQLEKKAVKSQVVKAMKKDLAALKSLLKKANLLS